LCSKGVVFHGVVFQGSCVPRELCSKGVVFQGVVFQGVVFQGSCVPRELCSKGVVFQSTEGCAGTVVGWAVAFNPRKACNLDTKGGHASNRRLNSCKNIGASSSGLVSCKACNASSIVVR
jgi:hypothetical protein